MSYPSSVTVNAKVEKNEVQQKEVGNRGEIKIKPTK
jgi:hypothetical protein